jgi:hypothetical protein
MTTMNRTGRRWASALVLLVGGAGVAVATWISGEHGFALFVVAFYVVFATAAYLWAGGSGDTAAIIRVGGDERQRGIDRDATAITGLVVIVFSIAGAIVQQARTGNPGAFGLICVTAGLTYAVSLFVVRRRR